MRSEQRRVEQQEERAARIGHVHRGDAAVAEVLLRKQQRRAVQVGDELVRRERLAVRQRGQPGVLLAASLPQIRHERIVELASALIETVVVLDGVCEQIPGLGAVSPPPRAQPAVAGTRSKSHRRMRERRSRETGWAATRLRSHAKASEAPRRPPTRGEEKSSRSGSGSPAAKLARTASRSPAYGGDVVTR